LDLIIFICFGSNKLDAEYSDDDSSDSGTEATSLTQEQYMEKKRNQSIGKMISPTERAGRRSSIRAERIRLDDVNTKIKMIPKTEEEALRIEDILKSCVLFRHLDQDQLKKLQGAMFQVSHSEGDTIIKQGEDGDNFYIVDDGSVDVFIRKEENEGDVLVASYGPGDSFGELAIMYNSPRAATCVTTSDTRLWALDRVSFKIILMATTMQKRDAYKNFLEDVPLLAELNEYEILTIADALQEECFLPGSTVCNEGDKGDNFYIVKEGAATCKKGGSDVAALKSGSYFGEIALMTAKPRQATVVAQGPENLICLSLNRKTFKRVMGSLNDILQRNMEAYNKFHAANI